MLRRRRLHRLRPERRGGVLLSRTPHSMRGKAEALAAISRRTVRNGRKQGRDWCVGDGGSGCCPLMVSYAPLSGLALAPKKPRAAATAALRIRSARRRTLCKTAQRARHRRNRKTLYVTSSRRTVYPRGQSESPRQNSWITVLFAPVTRSAGNAIWRGHSQSILLALNSLLRRVGPLSGQS